MTLPTPLSPGLPASDEQLLMLARGGDPDAQSELLGRHRKGAYFLALQLLGNPDDAMDATQDALLRFLTSLDRFQTGKPVRPWLYTIVRNRCRDLIRRRKVRRWEPLESDEETWRPELVDPALDPEETTSQRELQSRVWAGLSRLGSAQREILVLRDYQDLSYQEIAEVLSIPQGTVMSRLHRARKQLAFELAASPLQEPPGKR